MATTYAAYANVLHGEKAQIQQSQRTSISSNASTEAKPSTKKQGFWHKVVEELKPVEVPQEPVGIYSPIYQKPKKHSVSSAQSTKSRRASEMYDKFKTTVGGEKVYF